MSKDNRARLFRGILILGLTFAVLNTFTDGSRDLTIAVQDSGVTKVEVLSDERLLAVVEFASTPNRHTFQLPGGWYNLRIVSSGGVVRVQKIELNEDIELQL